MQAIRSPMQALRQRLRPQLRQRFGRWLTQRLARSDTLTLNQRNVYILPSRAGLMLATTTLVLLVASINYQLNLGYLLTFMVAGCAVVGIYVCHGTLSGMSMQLVAPQPVFARASAEFSIKLSSNRRTPRYGIGLAVWGHDDWVYTDVPAQGSATVQLAFTPPGRGRHTLPALSAETRFPLGTFRVWTVWRPASLVLVYPQPEQRPPPLPLGEPRANATLAQQAKALADTGEFDGVRAYQRGDPMKRIVWKKAAKADELVSRDAQQAPQFELWLEPRQTGLRDPEQQLSRLCAWVLMAERQQLRYGLRAGGQDIQPASGEAHKRHCLEVLALC